MKKILILSFFCVSIIVLYGCDKKDVTGAFAHDPVIENSLKAETKIKFDLISNNKVVITPSFLAMDKFDGTIDTEKTLDNPFDLSDPAVAMGKIDGWSITQKIEIDFTGVSLDLNQNPTDIFYIMESTDPTTPTTRDLKTSHDTMLVYGQDYVITINEFSIIIELLKPLNPNSNYMYALTDNLRNSNENSIGMTESYGYLKSKRTPPNIDLAAANKIINVIENSFKKNNVNPDKIVYSSWFTTESVGASLSITKSLIAKVLSSQGDIKFSDIWKDNSNPNSINAQQLDSLYHIDLEKKVAGNYSGALKSDVVVQNMLKDMIISKPEDWTAVCKDLDVLDNNSVDKCVKTALNLLSSYNAIFNKSNSIDVYHGTVMLPSFLEKTVDGDIWRTTPWQSATPSVAKIRAILDPKSKYSTTDKQYVKDTLNKLNVNLDGLFKLELNELIKLMGVDITFENGDLVDSEMLITKFSPIPKIKSVEAVPVLFFVPSESSGIDNANITIFQHGITAMKELSYMFTPIMEKQIEDKLNTRTAIVAIDTYLHGERGLSDPNGEEGNHDIVTNTEHPDVFMNLNSLTVGRDNMRQSIIDTIGLRAALSYKITHQDIEAIEVLSHLNQDNISYYGHSMGAISGLSSYAIANQPSNEDSELYRGLFNFTAGAFGNPGGEIASVLLESNTLGPVVTHKVLLASENKYSDYERYKVMCGDKVNFSEISTCLESYISNLPDSTKLEMDTMLGRFVYASQTVMGTVDPLSFANKITEPVYIMEAFDDQVVPNKTFKYSSLGGTEPLAHVLNLTNLNGNQSDEVNGLKVIARFNQESMATHLTLMLPIGSMGEPNATTEGNLEIGTFLAQSGKGIMVDQPQFLSPSPFDYKVDIHKVIDIDNELNPFFLLKDITSIRP
jgi:Pla-1/cef family extracellular lipase